jgi:hypothetical protein
VSGFGVTTLRIPECPLRVKEICGYVVLNQRLDINQSNDVCMLFLDRIQLIRFHHHRDKADSVQAVPLQHITDTVAGDTARQRIRKLGERPQPGTPAAPMIFKK